MQPETIAPAGTTTIPPELEQLPVRELVELLNDAFDVELQRRHASHRSEPAIVDHDAGVRAAKGLMVAGLTGLAMWTGILAVIIALAS